MDRRIKMMNICLTAVLSIGFILLAVFVFGESYVRFGEACVDMFNAGKYYVNELFETEYMVDLTYNRLSEVMRYDVGLPTEWNNFTLQMQVAWQRFTSKENLVAWGGNSLVAVENTAKVLVIVVPLLVVLYLLEREKQNVNDVQHSLRPSPCQTPAAIAAAAGEGQTTNNAGQPALHTFLLLLLPFQFVTKKTCALCSGKALQPAQRKGCIVLLVLFLSQC